MTSMRAIDFHVHLPTPDWLDGSRELKGRLSGQFVWGSDFSFISPERCLAELDELGLSSEILLHGNAARILGLRA
jgi:predicted TIM-barrel fold metal-dependent hydrolase